MFPYSIVDAMSEKKTERDPKFFQEMFSCTVHVVGCINCLHGCVIMFFWATGPSDSCNYSGVQSELSLDKQLEKKTSLEKTKRRENDSSSQPIQVPLLINRQQVSIILDVTVCLM